MPEERHAFPISIVPATYDTSRGLLAPAAFTSVRTSVAVEWPSLAAAATFAAAATSPAATFTAAAAAAVASVVATLAAFAACTAVAACTAATAFARRCRCRTRLR